MDAQELRNLSEAYMEVYQQLDEISDRKVAAVGRRRQANVDKAMSSDEYISDKPGATQKLATKISQKSRFDNLNKKRDRKKLQQEQVDLYDIILSHLLDEGYAETPEAAEAIMVNMSEDWRESIVEDAGIVSGLVGLALGAKGALHAAKKTKRLRDYPKNFVKGIADPRTYIPNKKKDKGG